MPRRSFADSDPVKPMERMMSVVTIHGHGTHGAIQHKRCG